jgi:hypothetical protein
MESHLHVANYQLQQLNEENARLRKEVDALASAFATVTSVLMLADEI